ncbi:hypothetical protein L3X38_003532 [Prunus dulcis]|uniref:Reverse transcriptase Ty1/copia-type domain-containing protein n=1 Tax=Prunus dulcis TaxID=3755 RepID=A0AAD5F222_PRUDU|nr:hypothetical protein L3X38_003532 [Prunus dulcis]
MDSMYTNQVWTSDPPPGIIPIGNKWIFKRKIDSDGIVEIDKARIVAKGYKQREGIDYEETFSPVAMTKSIRIWLAIAAYYDCFISKVDMHKVCKLHRSIYGLTQGSRSWNILFDENVKSFDFTQNMDDQ